MVRGVEDAAQEAGYSVQLANTDEDPEKEIRQLEIAAAEQLAGIILSPTSSTSANHEMLGLRGMPIVTVDRRLRGARIDSVTTTNRRAAFEATEHLIDQGCRRIGMIAGPSNVTTGAHRQSGYKSALKARQIELDNALIVTSNFRMDGGYQAAKYLLQLANRPDALLVSNSLMTIGALEAIKEADLRIPEDIALVAFDDVDWANALRAPLTVIAQPAYEVGRTAARLLLNRIRHRESPIQHAILPATLKIRQSSLKGGVAQYKSSIGTDKPDLSNWA